MVSVLVAVYNVEDYLPRCLDSVLSQTYHDLEIILVDDGSTDSSGSICEEYADKDDRIKVIHQVNEELSSARNAGLRAATGDYILMIDGDDALHPQMIEILYNLITSGDYDFSMCYGERICDVAEIGNKSKEVMNVSSSIELCPDLCMENLYMRIGFVHLQYASVWNKLYKKRLLENNYFKHLPSKDVLQDLDFNSRIYQQITKAILIPSFLYYYIQRPSSFQHLGLSMRMVNAIRSHYISLNEIPLKKKEYRAWCMMAMYQRMYNVKHQTKNTFYEEFAHDICSNVSRKTIFEFLMNTQIPVRKKCSLLLKFYFPKMYEIIVAIIAWIFGLKYILS